MSLLTAEVTVSTYPLLMLLLVACECSGLPQCFKVVICDCSALKRCFNVTKMMEKRMMYAATNPLLVLTGFTDHPFNATTGEPRGHYSRRVYAILALYKLGGCPFNGPLSGM